MNKCAILLKWKSQGTDKDAEIIKRTIEKGTNMTCDIIYRDDLKRRNRVGSYKIRIFIEHLVSNMVKQVKAAYTLFVPNVELLEEYDIKYLNEVNYVICKNELTYNYIKTMVPESKLVYTKFTSICENGPTCPKDPNLVAHFAGTAFLKGTYYLLLTWINNAGFLDINPNIKLIITKRYKVNNIFDKLLKDLWESLPINRFNQFYGRPINGQRYNNIYMFEYLSDDDFNYFAKRAGFSICPSIMEGYGHYINEARCNKSVVITTDASPMNELIVNTVQLAKVAEKRPNYKLLYDKWIHKGAIKGNIVDIEDLGDKMGKLFQLDGTELTNLANDGYNGYINDTKFFIDAFLELVRRVQNM